MNGFNQTVRTKLTHKGEKIQITTPYERDYVPYQPLVSPEDNHRHAALKLINRHLSQDMYTLASAWIDIEHMLEAVHVVVLIPLVSQPEGYATPQAQGSTIGPDPDPTIEQQQTLATEAGLNTKETT